MPVPLFLVIPVSGHWDPGCSQANYHRKWLQRFR
ncbi:hypothetical protein H9I48_05665 [Wolbachia pipientis]|nr:hypothetical protein [Wolbachia pipientis]